MIKIDDLDLIFKVTAVKKKNHDGRASVFSETTITTFKNAFQHCIN